MRHPAALLRRGPRGDRRGARRRASRSPASPAGRWSATRCSARSACSACPRSSLLRDLGPPARRRQPPARASTVWEPGMRVVRDVVGTPIRPPTSRSATWSTPSRRRSSPTDEDGEPSIEGVAAPGREVQGRRHPGPDGARRHHPGKGRENWAVDGILCLLQDLHPRRLPDLPQRAQTHHLLCPCHQSTFDLADAGKVIFGPAARALPQLPLDGGRRGLPRRTERLHRTRRAQLLGA